MTSPINPIPNISNGSVPSVLNNIPNVPSVPKLPGSIPSVKAGVTSMMPAAPPMVELDKLKQLPTTKDPELLKKQKEAEVQIKKTEAEQLKLQLKDMAISEGKNQLKALALSIIPFPPKLPILDPKILQALALARQAKKLIDERKKVSKENLKKNTETFKYPLTPTVAPPTPPTVDIPIGPKNPAVPDTTGPVPQPTTPPQPTKPIKSKFTYVLDGGGGLPFELVAMRYDGKLLNIVSWPINTKFAPYYSFNAVPEGLQSVKANIQFYIDRGTFDSYVSKPY